MPSPFPGMDPYLEAHWRDIQATLIAYARASLNKQLPRDLNARVEERVIEALLDYRENTQTVTPGRVKRAPRAHLAQRRVEVIP